MKSSVQFYLMILSVSLIWGCGRGHRSSSSSLETSPSEVIQAEPVLVKTLTRITGLGETQLEIYEGSESHDSEAIPIGVLQGQVKSTRFQANAEGVPFEQVQFLDINETYPVYLTETGSGQTRLQVFLKSQLLNAVKRPVWNQMKRAFIQEKLVCTLYSFKGAGVFSNFSPPREFEQAGADLVQCALDQAGMVVCGRTPYTMNAENFQFILLHPEAFTPKNSELLKMPAQEREDRDQLIGLKVKIENPVQNKTRFKSGFKISEVEWLFSI